MKFIVLILLIAYIYTDPITYINQCENEEYTKTGETFKRQRKFEAKSANDCKDRTILEYNDYYYSSGELAEYKIKTFYTHCCYVTYDRIKDDKEYDDEGKAYSIEGFCKRLTDSQYENIKDFILANEFNKERNNMKIDCDSTFLKIGFLSLLLFTLF